ncbi:recombinase family protein [Streptomyces sp. NPDC059506]|uniref:recombinase family protein n=1 Tax=Streptomyces sp. NPDC059506 TaxID=3347751 RepID=UPI002175505C|nr:recombinase family protein [Streptomyces sp. SCUT-3]
METKSGATGDPRATGVTHGHSHKRLARNAAEPMTLSAELQAGGIQLELLTGPPHRDLRPQRHGRHVFFAVLAVAGQIGRNYIREKTFEGQVIAASKEGQPRRTPEGHRR